MFLIVVYVGVGLHRCLRVGFVQLYICVILYLLRFDFLGRVGL